MVMWYASVVSGAGEITGGYRYVLCSLLGIGLDHHGVALERDKTTEKKHRIRGQ